MTSLSSDRGEFLSFLLFILSFLVCFAWLLDGVLLLLRLVVLFILLCSFCFSRRSVSHLQDPQEATYSQEPDLRPRVLMFRQAWRNQLTFGGSDPSCCSNGSVSSVRSLNKSTKSSMKPGTQAARRTFLISALSSGTLSAAGARSFGIP